MTCITTFHPTSPMTMDTWVLSPTPTFQTGRSLSHVPKKGFEGREVAHAHPVLAAIPGSLAITSYYVQLQANIQVSQATA